MPCYHPLEGFYSASLNSSGKRSIVFDRSKAVIAAQPVKVACGRCIGCRLERSRQWAMRCVHESMLHEFNCFLTLTYNAEHLPVTGSLVLEDLQLFMKRFRKRYSDITIRFLACGEYGETMSRPHYHLCIFGFDFPDRELYSERDGVRLYTSNILEKIWGKGFCTVGDLTFETAAYTARYITKKLSLGYDDDSVAAYENRYGVIDPASGEFFFLKPEFITMSRGGRTGKGLASGWYDLYGVSDLSKDFLTMRGVKMRPAKYYDYLYDLQDPEGMKARKKLRKLKAREFEQDNTPDRLRVKERVKLNRLTFLKRGYENET